MADGTEAHALLAGLAGAGTAPLDLAGAALALASFDRPGVGFGWYRQHLGELADALHGTAASRNSDIAGCAGTLSAVMAERFGYRGDDLTYDDMQNANLMRVIERRRGLPVALGILYIHAARSQGWQAEGLNFPGHFLVRLQAAGGRAILDPFNGGRMLEAVDLRQLLTAIAGQDAGLLPDYYEPVTDRDILLRLQNNILLRSVRQGAFERALSVIDRMLLFAPDHVPLWREAALVNARLERMGAAIEALERFVELAPSSEERHEAAALLQAWRGRLN
ncbi:SirB1 family protein [Oceanibaculum sp.]|uniref:SirB1 family protein n=1 Tax=Oceanibaculum sp. TaxID=1903597 RepID=UPI00258F99AE|nr:transglutaminase-like domain-containing protein [Oceanibaculum sp.]MCH2393577.1 transglutaminase-like domain-containing protein [Oceanibaculum sp.]